jgi:predicted ATPase/DNA-binding SARP family transcriptional activator
MKHKPEGATPGDSEALRIELLGGFRVSVGSRTIEEDAWRLRKAASLVKLVALSPKHRLHRERVMDLLWPELGLKAASNNLRQTLHVARRTLNPDPATASRYLELREEQLALGPEEQLWVDVDAFQEAAATARRGREPAAYRVALDLYTGELLPGDLYEEWAEGRRQELRRAFLSLLVELASLHEERGDFRPAVEVLQRTVAEEPTHEEAHVGLMRLYALSERRGEALSQYERLREALSVKLGAEPDAATRRLREEIATGRFPSAQPPTVSPPPEEAADVGKHNLPATRSSFVGREREMMEVRRELAMTRLLTLTGTGGCGKTRLALEVARELVGAYPDGVWLVELAPLSEGALVPQALAAALGVQEQPERSLTDTLVDFMRKKKALLVLDNCEHLVDAVARLADVLLYSCPHLKVLATSRETLDVEGELNWLVPSLSVPRLRRPPTVEELEGYESVRLFVERARYRNPAFCLTSENAQAVAKICGRLDGIPLAIELAAARVGFSVEQIATRLDDSLRLLTTGSRTASPRQRTLRGTLDWSYELLSEPEQKLFGRLSVFAGGWTLEAAEVVGAGGDIERNDVLDLLLQLVDKSLVTVETTGDGKVRYRMLEPVRQYALEKLQESGEAEDLLRIHAQYYLQEAETAEPGLAGAQQRLEVERLEKEHDNMRAALSWSLQRGEAELGLRFGGALWRFWFARGYLSEGLRWMERALAGSDAPTPARVKVLEGIGWLAQQYDPEQAKVAYEELLKLSRELGDKGNVATALNSLATLAALRGDHEWARALLEENLMVLQELEDEQNTATTLKRYHVFNLLGALAIYQEGDHARASELF